MTNELKAEPVDDNWEGYFKAIARNDEYHREYLLAFSQRAYEYGVLSIKNFTFMAGGALIALPAIASMTPALDAGVAAKAGLFFALSLLTSLVCTYLAHLNWSANYDLREEYRSRDKKHLGAAYLPSINPDKPDQDSFKRLEIKKRRFVWWTWILSHLSGLVGFGFFFSGCWILYQGISIVGISK